MLEEELALHVIAELENLGMLVFKEVSIHGGGSRRVDMFAAGYKDGNIVKSMAIETKMSFNLTVIEQAYKWKKNANTSWVAVPAKTKSNSRFGIHVCKSLGLGVIEVARNGDCFISLDAEINDNPKLPDLYPEQLESVAGNANGEFRTPFNITVERLRKVLENGPSTFAAAMDRCGHHYKNPKTALNSISKHIDSGLLSDLEMYREQGKLMIKLKPNEDK